MQCTNKFFRARKSIYSARKSICSAQKYFYTHEKMYQCVNVFFGAPIFFSMHNLTIMSVHKRCPSAQK